MKNAIPKEDLGRLLATAPAEYAELYRFLAESGCRRGEALALTGAQVERTPERTVVRIEPHTLPGGRLWEPKTLHGTRALAIPPDVVPLACDSAYVFLPELKRPIHNTKVDRALTRHCESAGIPRVTYHAFRRFRITQALLAGAEPVALSRAVGHRTLATTLTYLRNVPMLHELPDVDAEPAVNPAAAAWSQATTYGKSRKQG